MRVVAGVAGGMRLDAPSGRDVRPVPDKVREALFHVLGERIAGAAALDLFAGSGAVGIEALSRGAASCVFVERSPRVRQVLERNLAHTRLAPRAHVLQCDAFRCAAALARLDRVFDFVFLGPPFPLWDDVRRKAALLTLMDRLATERLLAAGGVLVAQHDGRIPLPETTKRLTRRQVRAYGRNRLTFYGT
jgi:16S rRNA (guanine(966)-N(2))-methyltransferase RsmD